METHKKTWQIDNLGAGLYFIKMTINGSESTIEFRVNSLIAKYFNLKSHQLKAMAFLLYLLILKTHNKNMKIFFTFFFSFVVSFLHSQSTYIVNNLSDNPTSGSGLNGSMRYCINQANANTGLDTIKFGVVTDNLPIIIDSTIKSI